MYDNEYFEDIDSRAEYEAMCEAEAQEEAKDYADRIEYESNINEGEV